MQAKGYEKLARKAKDDRAKRLLAEISSDEVKDSEYWSQKIQELAGKDAKSARVSSINRKVGLLMGILGTRGFLEWAIIVEGEGIEDLAIQAANVNDLATSEEWTRIASYERLHVERVKKRFWEWKVGRWEVAVE